MEKFTFFWSGIFSQWHPAAFNIDGIFYNCAEQYMMAEKARLFKDDVMEMRIMKAALPSDQKRLGRQVTGFDLDIWNSKAKDIVYRGNYAKFTQNENLKQELLKTVGTTLVEASPHDTIWGIGLLRSDRKALNRNTWRGTNWLGEILTKVRDDLMKETQ